MKIRAKKIDFKDAERFVSFPLFTFYKPALFNFALENDARIAVETFRIFRINLHAQLAIINFEISSFCE